MLSSYLRVLGGYPAYYCCCVYGGQRIVWSCFSPSTFKEGLGFELKSVGLHSKCLYPLSLLTGPLDGFWEVTRVCHMSTQQHPSTLAFLLTLLLAGRQVLVVLTVVNELLILHVSSEF